jgi:hypothetical protein
MHVFVYKFVLYELLLPIGHVPTQIYVNKTYMPHYNLAIIYIYFVEYIFFYTFFAQKCIEYQISIRIPFSLKKDEKLHIWFSLFNFLSETSDVIKK